MYAIVYTKKATKDIKKIKESGMSKKAKNLIDIIKKNPFHSHPPYEKLLGNLSRCIFKTNKYTT